MGKVSYLYDISKTGFEIMFKPYQEVVMKHLWEKGAEGVTSGKAWIAANKVLLKSGDSKSRASIIFFLQDMVAAGYLKFTTATGKGGHHRVYTALYNETEFKEEISKRIMETLLESFPDETSSAMINLIAARAQGHQGPQS